MPKTAKQYENEATKIANSLDSSFHKWELEMEPEPNWNGYMVSRFPSTGSNNLFLVIGMKMEYGKFNVHSIFTETSETIEAARKKAGVHAGLSSFSSPKVGSKDFVTKAKLKNHIISLMKSALSPAATKDSVPYIEKASLPVVLETKPAVEMAAASAKFYNALAKIIKEERSGVTPYIASKIDAMAHDMAVYLKSTNPNFDKMRFLTACGIKKIDLVEVAKLSRKDYKTIAGVLGRYYKGAAKEVIEKIAGRITYLLHQDNPRFNSELFIKSVKNNELASLEEAALPYHRHLNPKLFDSNDMLLEPVRQKLLKIGEMYKRFLRIKHLHIVDVIFKGSNANFNYHKKSDIDVHLVVRDLTEEQAEIVSLRNQIWKTKYGAIKIKGYDVEVGVDVAGVKHSSAAVYSLQDNEWVSRPEYQKPKASKSEIKKLVRTWKRSLVSAMKSGDPKKVRSAFQEIMNTRKEVLDGSPGVEFSVENLAYKELRNMGLFNDVRRLLEGEITDDLSLSPDNPVKMAFIKMSRMFRKPGMKPLKTSPQSLPNMTDGMDFLSLSQVQSVELSSRAYYAIFGFNKKSKKWQVAFSDYDRSAVEYELEVYRDGNDSDELSKITSVVRLGDAKQETIDAYVASLNDGSKNPKSYKVQASAFVQALG